MQNPKDRTLELLLNVVATSALKKINWKIGFPDSGAGATQARELGFYCHANGTDARSAQNLWAFLDDRTKAEYAIEYERDRPIQLKNATPRAIYEGLQRCNQIRWKEWHLECGDIHTVANKDDIGFPGYAYQILVTNTKTQVTTIFDQATRKRCWEICEFITGEAFLGSYTVSAHCDRNGYQKFQAYGDKEEVILARSNGDWAWASEEIHHWDQHDLQYFRPFSKQWYACVTDHLGQLDALVA